MMPTGVSDYDQMWCSKGENKKYIWLFNLEDLLVGRSIQFKIAERVLTCI